MHNFSIYSLALTLASLAQAAPSPAAPVSVFYVKNFRTLCTETTVEHECTTNFDVTYSNSPSYHCSLNGTESTYVYCQNPGPEAFMAAYIEAKAVNGHPERTLKLHYELEFPGKVAQDTYGSQVLSKAQGTTFGVVAETKQ